MGSFYGAYNFLLKEDEPKEGNNLVEKLEEKMADNKEEKSTSGTNKKVSKILDFRVSFLSFDEEDKKVKYYNLDEGGFWVSSFDGSFKKKITSDKFDNLKEVKWSKDKRGAIIKIDDAYYYYMHGKEKNLIKKSNSMSWLNFDQEIIYTFADSKTGKKSLNFANPDGTDWREIGEIKSDNLIMQTVPKSSKSSFWPKADSFSESEMMIVSAGGLDMVKKGDPKYGADYLWSPEGDKFLRSYVSEKGGNNLVLESCGEKEMKCVDLNMPTIAAKCVWLKDGDNIICAQIKNLSQNLVMPNDYFSRKFISEDTFWKINVNSGKKEKIVEDKDMEENVDAIDLIVSSSEDFIFFINRKNDNLFRLAL